MRPDIAISIPDRGYHLFDAKFRMRLVSSTDAVGDAGDGEGSDRDRTFKRNDLNKMHAYRDAIPSSLSSWVLYPGTEEHCYGVSTDATSVNSAWQGVGAIPCLPGDESSPSLGHLLANLVGA